VKKREHFPKTGVVHWEGGGGKGGPTICFVRGKGFFCTMPGDYGGGDQGRMLHVWEYSGGEGGVSKESGK